MASSLDDASTPLPAALDIVEIAREGTRVIVEQRLLFATSTGVTAVSSRALHHSLTAAITRPAALNGPQGYNLKLFPFPPSHEFRCWICAQVARQAVVINGDPWCACVCVCVCVCSNCVECTDGERLHARACSRPPAVKPRLGCVSNQ